MFGLKRTARDLALFGGPPAFDQPLHVGRPNIGNRGALLARIQDILDRKWLTNEGVYVRELEQRIAEFAGVRHCVATCNATAALQIAIKALGLEGEAIVPSFTFVATAHALEWQGVTPVFCDIDPATHNLDPAAVDRAITPRTSAIVGVHVWGRPCDVDALTRIARARRLRLLFDAAHAFDCSLGARMIGGFGDAEVFSFHATKFVNAFEGGAITTNDGALADRLRLMTNFGFAGLDTVVSLGINAKMSEVSAAMGLTSLESRDEWIAVNQRNHALYRGGLAGLPGIALATAPRDGRYNYQYVVIEVDEATAGISRDALQAVLHAEHVFARRYFYPGCHRMEPYRSKSTPVDLPQTERLANRVLCLPTGTEVEPSAIAAICDVIAAATGRAAAVAARWSELRDRQSVAL